MSKKITPRDGDNLTFDFFKDLFVRRRELADEFSCELVRATAIWLPIETYKSCPILLPWVVRDNHCRKGKGRQEAWGSPNSSGHFRDDNSMVKGLVRGLAVAGPKTSSMNRHTLGTGWVASHVWISINGSAKSSNTDASLNTFVPNLVWLPRQIAKLSDQDQGPIQTALKQVSREIYGNVEVDRRFQSIAQDCWAKLPPPDQPGCKVEHDALNWFVVPSDFVEKRQRATQKVLDSIKTIQLEGKCVRPWRICRRYSEGLPGCSAKVLRELEKELKPHTGS